MVIYLDSLVQLCCKEGGALQTNITDIYGECSQCLSPTGFVPTHSMCVSSVYTAQAPDCSAGELSKVGPELRSLPRSKPLRFRFSGSPQRCRRGWACFLCLSQVPAAQATMCLASALSPIRCAASYHLPYPSHSVSWVRSGSAVSGMLLSPLGS